MSLLHEAVLEKKFDTRVVERNINRGMTQPSELKKFLEQLPDDSENADFSSVDELIDEDALKN